VSGDKRTLGTRFGHIDRRAEPMLPKPGRPFLPGASVRYASTSAPYANVNFAGELNRADVVQIMPAGKYKAPVEFNVCGEVILPPVGPRATGTPTASSTAPT
jgi:hypothetical protein